MAKHTTLDQMKMLAVRVKKEMLASGLAVPTKLSELTNDAGFITETEAETLIAGASHLKRKIVSSIDDIDLTAEDADMYIYLVKVTEPPEEEGGDPIVYYNEYMVIGGKVDPVGNTKVDLTDYVKKSDAATNAEVEAMLNDVFGPATPPSEDEGEETP